MPYFFGWNPINSQFTLGDWGLSVVSRAPLTGHMSFASFDLTPPSPAVILSVTLGLWTLASYFVLRGSGDDEPAMVKDERNKSSEYFSAILKDNLDNMGTRGGTERGFTWSQTDNEIVVCVPMPAGARGHDCVVKVLEDKLTITIKSAVVVQGKLFRRVKTDDTDWSIEDVNGERVLKLTLEKLTPTKGSLHWKALLLQQVAA